MAGTSELNMDDMWTLLLLSLAILVGCYLAGSIPLACSLSEVRPNDYETNTETVQIEDLDLDLL